MIDRAELQEAARKAFGENGHAPDAEKSWGLIADMGWLMMAVPEELGGLGLGREAEGVIHNEIGHALVPGPVIAQMLVITALSQATDLPERDDLLTRAMGGEVMTASLEASLSGDGFEKAVPDADRASHILVANDDLVALYPMDTPGTDFTPRTTWDETRRLFDVMVSDVGGAFIIAKGEAASVLTAKLKAQTLFALAGDSQGGAAAILELTIDYLETRRQFDRPLAMFQALKHRVADLKTQLVAADALFWSRAYDETTLIEMAALKSHACRVYADVTEEAVQLHGGIGLTSEYYCHLFLKRAMLNAVLGGDADYWEEAVGRAQLAF